MKILYILIRSTHHLNTVTGMLKPIALKSLTWVKLGGFIAKLALACTAISTIATLFDTIETEMGGVIDAICVATYLIARNLSVRSYDRTTHIPPK